MKYVLAQVAFKLPENFDLKKGDLNQALEAIIIHRMIRDRTCKSKKAKPRKLKDWGPIKDLLLSLWKGAGKSDRRLVAVFGFGEIADPPKKPAKRPLAR